MSGKNAGVVAKVLKEEPKALYTRCYGHSSSLACGDAIKHSKIMKDSLDTTHEITKLIKKSPRRVTLLEKLKSELAPFGKRFVKRLNRLDYEAELKCVANFYTTDFNYELLKNSAGDTES